MGSGGKSDGDLNWAKALDLQQKNREHLPEGKGWRTYDEILKDSPVADTNTRKMLRNGLENKEMECFEGRVIGAYGKLVRRVWYRPI